MFDKTNGTVLKKVLQYFSFLMIFGFAFSLFAPASIAASSDTQFIAMYKGFFNDMKDKKYQKVWDEMTISSKKQIAKTITDAILKDGKQVTEDQTYQMLENNTSDIRTTFFNNLNSEFDKLSFWPEMLTADYTVKSSSKDRVVLTISVKNDPKDFQILNENGAWKINFFTDLFQ